MPHPNSMIDFPIIKSKSMHPILSILTPSAMTNNRRLIIITTKIKTKAKSKLLLINQKAIPTNTCPEKTQLNSIRRKQGTKI